MPERLPDWEAFYASYRKPGYVPGFEITSKLGGGMFGLVFKAVRQSIGKDYAIKFLRVDDGEIRRAVLAELESVQYFAQIDHPNLVSIEDRGEVDGIPFLIMAYAGAETLSDRLPGEVGNQQQCVELLRLFAQACRGVAALHERSLVHFDLKPANVFLKGGVARVGDYGLSKLVTHSRGSLSMGRGTPYYMAPEMLQRRGDHRSDVYSLGIMLYEVVCGDVPFKGESEWEVLRKHELEAPAFPPHVSPRERAIIERCLAKDPAQRFQSVHDLVAVLAPLCGGIAAGPEGVTTAAAAAAAAVLPGDREAMTGVAPSAGPLPSQAQRDATLAARKGRSSESSEGSDAAEFVATAWSPPPVPRSRLGIGRLVWVAALMCIALVWFSKMRIGAMEPRAVSIATAASRTPREHLLDEIERLSRDIERGVAEVRFERARDLGIEMPADASLYRQEIETFAHASRAFSPSRAQRLAELGYPMVLAAVQWLQDQDYDECASCMAAANVQNYLRQATGIQGLAISPPSSNPTRSDRARFRATAAAWRHVVREFCHNEQDFERVVSELRR